MKRTSMAAAAVALVTLAGTGVAFAQGMTGGDLLNGKLFGNIPNVTVRGVQAGTAPWVVDGTVKLTSTDLVASGKWLIIPKTGYLANGKPVPAALGGTTAGIPSVAAEITFANAKPIITKSVPLSKNGDFKIDVMLNIPKGAADPVVLIGPVANGQMKAWFASSNFLMDYGWYTPSSMGSGKSSAYSSSGW